MKKYGSFILPLLLIALVIACTFMRFSRHPAYTGMLAAHGGIIVFFFNYVSGAVYLLVFIPSIIVRILVEEKTLFGIDGYADFARNRKRLIPGIW